MFSTFADGSWSCPSFLLFHTYLVVFIFFKWSRRAAFQWHCMQFMTWHAELRVENVPVGARPCCVNYTLQKVAHTRTLVGKKRSECRCCCVWFPLQRIRYTDLVVNYESNHWPSCFLREGVCWLNKPWQAAPLPFICLIWVDQEEQRKIILPTSTELCARASNFFFLNRKCFTIREARRSVK